ncbi:MAG: hypothetical protein NTV58_18610 [Deltaproteobacteria bacterium]|nr:hypothetical protein [Deltaproteobacteria bacterium]
MNVNPYEIALIAGGFTIVGALIGGWIGYRNALKLHNIVEFNKAATEFRNAFLYELIYLKHNACIPEGERTYTTLNEFLFAGYVHRHLKAFEVFRNYLSSKDRADIDKAWKEHCHYDIEGETGPFFAMYAEDTWEGKDTKELALERIEELLKYAKHK